MVKGLGVSVEKEAQLGLVWTGAGWRTQVCPNMASLHSAQQELCPVGMQAQCGLVILSSVFLILECFRYLLWCKKAAPSLVA